MFSATSAVKKRGFRAPKIAYTTINARNGPKRLMMDLTFVGFIGMKNE
jgi:hypothetical protein